jgi:hypothetical protein
MNKKEQSQILDPLFKQIQSKWYNVCISEIQIDNVHGIEQLKNHLIKMHELTQGLNSNVVKKVYKNIVLKKNIIDIKSIEQESLNIVMYSLILLQNIDKSKDKGKHASEVIKKMKSIMGNKSHDYSEDKDILSNFKMTDVLFGVPAYTGVLIRMSDKVSRIQNITAKGSNKVKDESMQDTLLDLANYSLLFYLCVIDQYDPSYRPKFNTIS